jgi:hypothetical protein
VLSVWSAGEYIRFFVLAAEEKARRMRPDGDEPPAG